MNGLPAASTIAPIATSLSFLAKKWRVLTQIGLREKCSDLKNSSYLIADLLPAKSLSIVVGDSGLGKSPFLYQAAICVAQGISFIGHRVSQGRVLYLDYENGLGSVSDLADRLSVHLGQAGSGESLFLWNYNDAPADWKSERLMEMISDVRPVWIIIDSLSAFAPDIEEKSSHVTRTYQQLRDIIKEHQCAITVVHHIRKPSNKPQEAAPALGEDVRGWFLQTRGSRQLINGMDIRIGIDQNSVANLHTELDGRSVEVAFYCCGIRTDERWHPANLRRPSYGR